MSASPGHPSLRACIAATLSDVLAENTHRGLADDLGVSGSTIPRRGDDLTMWPATDLLKLAVMFPALGEAVQIYLTGDAQPKGEAVAVVGDLHQSLTDCAALIGQTSAALSDGVVTIAEAKTLRGTIDTMMVHLNQLHRDLSVVHVGGRS